MKHCQVCGKPKEKHRVACTPRYCKICNKRLAVGLKCMCQPCRILCARLDRVHRGAMVAEYGNTAAIRTVKVGDLESRAGQPLPLFE